MAEDYVGGVNSIFMQRGWLPTRRGYGVYATSNRIFLVKGGVGYLVVSLAFYVLILALTVRFLSNPQGSLVFSPAGVVFGLFLLYLFLADEKLEHQGPKPIDELERRRDFEASRGEILDIEVKRPGGLRGMGHLLIRLRSGEPVKVLMFSYVGGGGRTRFVRMVDLMQAFCGKPPSTQSSNLSAWTL